jgi:antitoxin VapB
MVIDVFVTDVYTSVYTPGMAARAKIFHNGGSQAVRLPKAVRFLDDQKEVLVHRVGRRVILEPADEWSAEFRKAIGAWHERIERPRSRKVTTIKDPVE